MALAGCQWQLRPTIHQPPGKPVEGLPQESTKKTLLG